MAFKEFGVVVDDQPKKFKEFGTVVDETSRTRSLLSAAPKGAVKGALELASMADPIKYLLGVSDTTPHQKQAIEKTLPTQEKPLEKGLERAGRLAVQAAGGGESFLAKGLRAGAGAVGGQLAEEMGAPEWAQNLAELAAFMSPSLAKKLKPTPSQKEAVEFLRSKGLTDKEITPLLKSEKKIRSLGRLSKKGSYSKDLTESISEKFGSAYETLKEQGASKFLKGQDAVAFDDKLGDTLSKIRPKFARLIEKDVEALRDRGISQKNLIDFYQDINDIVGSESGGKAVLGVLKKPVIEALEKIDPKSAQEFTKLNHFYGKKAVLQKALTPDKIDHWLKKGKIYGAVAGVATGNPGILKTVLTEEVGSRVFKHLLTNPRLQNISNKILEAMDKNKEILALKAFKMFEKELKKEDPKLADLLPVQ